VFVWDTSALAVGTYQIAARISDGRSQANSPACCLVTIVEPPTACSDGIDNDGDGKIDYPDDDGCVAANGRTEVRGDIDFDGDVDGVDRAALSNLAGAERGDPDFVEQADLDGDGRITSEDSESFGAAVRAYIEARFPNAICGISGFELVPLLAFLSMSRVRMRRAQARKN
jgi:hypothetical protein